MSRRKRITGGMLSSANGNRGDEFQLLSRSSSSNIIPSSQTNNNSSNATESNNNSTSTSATTQEPKSPASSENVIPASSGSETNTNTTNGEVHNNGSSSKKTTELPQPESTLENQQSNPSSESITAMTYNITAQPLVEEDSDEDSWKQRRETIANTIVKASPDILAIQDASFSQVQDLEKLLSSSSVKYEWFGQGSIYYGLPIQKKEEEAEEEDEERDPRPNINHKDFSGEYVPIFYNSTKLKLLQCGTFWLSKDETLQGSRGWDSVAPRICTFCKFKDRRTKKAFLVFNTHFDQGRFARKNSCVLMRRKILELAIDPESDEILPAILLGDLNIAAASPLFAFLTTGQKPAAQTGKKGSPEETMEEMEYESEDEAADLQFAAANEVGTPTYTGFTSSLNSTVDYVLVTHETISVTKSSVLSDTRENGRQASTHRPVLAELVIQ